MFIINTFSTCFGHHYAHLQENKTCSNTHQVLLKMGIMMPETCWKSIDNKHLTVASCWFSLSLQHFEIFSNRLFWWCKERKNIKKFSSPSLLIWLLGKLNFMNTHRRFCPPSSCYYPRYAYDTIWVNNYIANISLKTHKH